MRFKKSKLTIELVPKSSWFTNVRSQVNEEDWDKLRREAYRKANYLCEICGGRGSAWPVECHEVWSYVSTIRQHTQKLERLTALCPACHEVKHIGLAQVKGNLSRAVKHLAKVNDWSLPQAHAYVTECMDLWCSRSEISWELDLSFLDEKRIKYETKQKLQTL